MSSKEAEKRAKEALAKAKSTLTGMDEPNVNEPLTNGLEESGAELNGMWAEASDMSRVREAVTFDRHASGYSLVKIKYQNSKVVSITKLQPDTEGNALRLAEETLKAVILHLKKTPSDTLPK